MDDREITASAGVGVIEEPTETPRTPRLDKIEAEIDRLQDLLSDTRLIMDDLRLRYDSLGCELSALGARLLSLDRPGGKDMAAIEADIQSIARLLRDHRHDSRLGIPVVPVPDFGGPDTA